MPSSDDPHVFRAMMERAGLLAPRLQIDLMDGDFAPHRNIEPSRVWWPDGVRADLHVMYRHPEMILDTLLGLHPHCIILHVESEANILQLLRTVKQQGIRAGIAILPKTNISDVAELIQVADHVLLFGGKLGEPGNADLRVLSKVPEVRALNARVEIGWDGGANEGDVAEIAAAGIDIINVGSALQRAENPADEYRRLVELAS